MADFRDFKFTGPRLDDFDLPRIGKLIGVGEDIVHGVMDTEAAGKSVDKNGRMKALYEPHVAYRNSKGAVRDKLVAAGLAYPKWKKDYPADSYPRIKRALAIDERVACLAASWGFPQILGENFALAGYPTPQAMVLDMLADEDNQLEAMIRFIKAASLDDELRVLEAKLKHGQRITPDDARPFVRGYNGPGYAKNDYHTTFAKNVNKWAKIPDSKATAPAKPKAVAAVGTTSDAPAKGDGDLIDELAAVEAADVSIYDGKYHAEIEAMQKRLNELGYPEFGGLDGKWGTKTRAALLAFKADNGLPLTPIVDDQIMAALMVAKPRYVNPARANATVADLRSEGAAEVKTGDMLQFGGAALALGGAATGGETAIDKAERVGGLIGTIAEAVAPIQVFIAENFWLVALVGGALIIWQSGILKRLRVDKHKSGEDVSL